jgi:hypothetical protein
MKIAYTIFLILSRGRFKMATKREKEQQEEIFWYTLAVEKYRK